MAGGGSADDQDAAADDDVSYRWKQWLFCRTQGLQAKICIVGDDNDTAQCQTFATRNIKPAVQKC